MIGEAARVVGQKGECFDCITHPERKKEAAKRCGYSETQLLSTQKWKSRGKKKRPHCCSLSLKKGSVYICQWDKRYCEALLRYTWHGPERQVGYWTSEFWSNNLCVLSGKKEYKRMFVQVLTLQCIGPKSSSNAPCRGVCCWMSWGCLDFPLFSKQRWSL